MARTNNSSMVPPAVQTEREARELAEQKLRLAMWASRETVWTYQVATGDVQTTRYDRQQQASDRHLTHVQFFSMVHPEDRAEVEAALESHISGLTDVLDIACRYYLTSHLQWIRIRGQAIDRAELTGRAAVIVGTARDITEQQLQLQKLDRLAQFDALTGLYNRHSFQLELDRYLANHTKVAVMFVDMDGFKELNDALGHAAGDEFLAAVAQTLRTILPRHALIARYGGDEFVVAMHFESDSTWRGYAKKLITAKTPYQPLRDVNLSVTGSIGVALFPQHSQQAQQLIECADTAMYEAKRKGGDMYIAYRRKLSAEREHKNSLLVALKKAVMTQTLSFDIQPVYNSQLDMIGGELLCRWYPPEFGAVSPAEFIPLAEQHGLTAQITLQALDNALALLAQDMVDREFWLAINICPHEVLNVNFVTDLANHCHAAGISPDRIKLEVTETVFLHEEADPERCLESAKALGFSLAMDDFGTGYSSLAYINRYPFDAVKIDKLFVDQMMVNSKSRQLIEGIAGLCNSLDIDIVAEGCETSEQIMHLRALGISALQGFGLSKPLAQSDFLDMLRYRRTAS